MMLKKSLSNRILVHGMEAGISIFSRKLYTQFCFSGRNEFEVYIDGVLVFSKLKEGYFPDLDVLVAEVR